MHIITLATEKGGPGKSTLGTSLAVAAVEAGEKVMLVELDQQGTTSNWAAQRETHSADVGPDVTTAHSRDLADGLKALNEASYTTVVVDTPGHDSVDVRPALALSTFIVIPTRPTVADLNGSMTTIEVAQRLSPPFLIVLTQTGAAKGDAKVREASEALAGIGPVFDRIVSRQIYQDALGAGYGVTELEPKGKSAEEVRGLWRRIVELIEEAA